MKKCRLRLPKNNARKSNSAFLSTAELRCRATSGQGDATICIKQSPSGLIQSQGAVARALREYGGHSCKVMLYMFCRSSVACHKKTVEVCFAPSNQPLSFHCYHQALGSLRFLVRGGITQQHFDISPISSPYFSSASLVVFASKSAKCHSSLKSSPTKPHAKVTRQV